MRIKGIAQGHYCHSQQIQTGDLTTEPQQLLKWNEKKTSLLLSVLQKQSHRTQIRIENLTRSIRDSETYIDFVQGPPGSRRKRVNITHSGTSAI